MLIKLEPISDELKKEDRIAFERGIQETLNLDIKPDPKSTLNIQSKITKKNQVKKEDTTFQHMLIKTEPIIDDFKPKIEFKKEEITFKRGIEETLNLEIKTDPESISYAFKPKIEFKKEEIAFKRGIEEALNLEIKVDLEPISEDFKPKIELKKEDAIAFKKGIEETLNLEIRADPEASGNIRSKIKKKNSRFPHYENDRLNKAVNTAVNVISHENDKRSKCKVQKIQSNKNFRIPKLSDKVQEKSPKTGSIHDGKKRFKCAMCSERFSQRNDLNQRFHCDKCSAEEKKRLSKFKKSNGEDGLTKAELKGFQGLTKAELMDNTKVKEEVLKKKEGKGRDF